MAVVKPHYFGQIGEAGDFFFVYEDVIVIENEMVSYGIRVEDDGEKGDEKHRQTQLPGLALTARQASFPLPRQGGALF
jgi:hypothetical protein